MWWEQEKFEAEMAAARLAKGLGPKNEGVEKPSGKEMFLRNLVSALDGADIEEEEGASLFDHFMDTLHMMNGLVRACTVE